MDGPLAQWHKSELAGVARIPCIFCKPLARARWEASPMVNLRLETWTSTGRKEVKNTVEIHRRLMTFIDLSLS